MHISTRTFLNLSDRVFHFSNFEKGQIEKISSSSFSNSFFLFQFKNSGDKYMSFDVYSESIPLIYAAIVQDAGCIIRLLSSLFYFPYSGDKYESIL